MYFILYTICASLPLLLSFLLFRKAGLGFFRQLKPVRREAWGSVLFLGRVSLAFLVKLPLCIPHLWLTKAHVEAPVAGSIILASVLLKLGGLGLIRVSPVLTPGPFTYFVIVWALVGSVYIGVLCVQRRDIKILIALSSVSHIRLVAAAVITNSF